MSKWSVPLLLIPALLLAPVVGVQAESVDPSTDSVLILPGDERFDLPRWRDYEALYTSSSSKNGQFTLIARRSGDGSKLSLIDLIPMQDNVIVAQRIIDYASWRVEAGAGPYFAWGAEMIISQSSGALYDWVRVPIGGGEPQRMQGPVAHQGYVSDMFAPTLAALMPLPVGSRFQLPAAYPRKGGTVSSELDEYRVLRREVLRHDNAPDCECWLIEKRPWSGAVEHLWVDREAPYVFRRTRDPQGEGEFTSALEGFRWLPE